jgi:tetratricopeptide (TPR) repeat protein
VVYARILQHDFLNLDDKWYVTMNPDIAGFTWQHIKEIFSSFYIGNYAPVQMLSYMLDYTIWNIQPGGFLLSNIIIHIANGLMVYRLFIRFHGTRLIGLVAAEIFLLHPVQVETVAWISQRKNLLAMLFFLLAWEYYCRYREKLPEKRKFAYFLSLAFFVLALLSKSVSVILPVVLVMYDFYYFEGKQRVQLVDKLPFIVAAGITSVVTMYSQLSYIGEGGRVEELHGGSALATFFTMMPVFCRYLGMIFWPSSLSADYNPPIYQSLNVVVAGSFLIILAVFWGGLRLYRQERRIAFWVPFFFVALLPVSQIVPLFTLMSDRYLYFPMLSVAALAGFAASVLKKRCYKYSNLVTLFILLPLLSLSILTYNRAGFWRNSVILWTDATSKVTDCARIWGYMGNAYDEAKDRGSAIYSYNRGLAINPNDMKILYDSGSMYLLLGDNEQAYSILKKLMGLAPNHIMGLVAFGDVSVLRGDYAEAEKSYYRANQLQPNAPDPLIKLGNLAVVTNRLNDALGYYLHAEEVYEGHPEIAYNIACVESLFGRVDSSLFWLDKALQRGYKSEFTLRSNEELLIVREDVRFEQLLSHNFHDGKSR